MSGGGGFFFEEADDFEAGFESGSEGFLLLVDFEGGSEAFLLLVCFFLFVRGCFSRAAFDLDGCQLPALS